MSDNQELIAQHQQEVLLTGGRIAAQTGVLELRQRELNSLFPDLRREVALLGARMGSLKAVSTLSVQEQKQIVTRLRDSISVTNATAAGQFAHPADTLSYHVFHYHDEYYDIHGWADSVRQWLNISSRDTMTQVVYVRRRYPWLWILSPRKLEQRVYFKNPGAHIEYSRTINIIR
ncbi:hypothetical protein GCM10023092_23200 [Rurimicrobium arvi]|uniref:Uncharacterized protein n=2 Tax=Rurimicrobium arvi TaxID=2049916 RepID=A0ABP8MYG5_9BACT